MVKRARSPVAIIDLATHTCRVVGDLGRSVAATALLELLTVFYYVLSANLSVLTTILADHVTKHITTKL